MILYLLKSMKQLIFATHMTQPHECWRKTEGYTLMPKGNVPIYVFSSSEMVTEFH